MHLFFRALLLLLITLPAVSGEIPRAEPADLGFSGDGLDALSKQIQAMVDGNKIAGASALIYRKGKVAYFEQFGKSSLETGEPMKPDALFRIFSMTKPVTSTAIMILVEDGKLGLDDPVKKYIPAMADMKVYAGSKDGEAEYQAPERPMTVRDLLRHTSGLTYGYFGNTVVDGMYVKANLLDVKDSAGFTEKLGKLPLLAHPGSYWCYSVATDVLGHLVQVVSGKSLADFVEERICRPLGMNDTFFEIPKDKMHRMAELYTTKDGKLTPQADSMKRWIDVTLYSGGGGMISSIQDYLRFTRMILSGGELDGKRLLKRETVALMTTNQLPEEAYPIGFGPLRYHGHGFGLGFAVLHEPEKTRSKGRKGMAYWSGYANTYFFIDKQTATIGLLMTQYVPFGLESLGTRFQNWVFEAMTD
ncbi:MAG: serine hydrolase domain-containing protein [Acidobacteriota bacterium]|nr:serine hydrolase domain-containing protein [Acidobacteriota bacterium]